MSLIVKEKIPTFDFIKDNNFSELKEAELMKERLSLLSNVDPYTGRYFSQAWIQRNVLRMNDDDIKKMQEEIHHYLSCRFKLKDLTAVTYTDTTRALFCSQKNNMRGFSANTLAQHFHYIYKNANVVGASSHSGRRGFITNLANRGVSVRVLMELSGHKSIAVTQRYIDINPSMLRSAVEML